MEWNKWEGNTNYIHLLKKHSTWASKEITWKYKFFIGFRIAFVFSFFFFLKIYWFFLMKDNCFTEFWCFLSNINMNINLLCFSDLIKPKLFYPQSYMCMIAGSLQPSFMDFVRNSLRIVLKKKFSSLRCLFGFISQGGLCPKASYFYRN